MFFKGDCLILHLLATLMVPLQVIKGAHLPGDGRLGLQQPVALPSLWPHAQIWCVFTRQYKITIPDEIIEVARMMGP